MSETVDKWGKDADELELMKGIDKAIGRLKNVRNGSQLASIFHSIGSGCIGIRMRSRGMIGVQPTSVSRRRPNLPHGRKRLAAGRPAGSKKDGFSAARRKRCLAINVQNNKPNAKTHRFFCF